MNEHPTPWKIVPFGLPRDKRVYFVDAKGKPIAQLYDMSRSLAKRIMSAMNLIERKDERP